MTPLDITKLSDEQIKAIGYDEMAKLEQAQKNLQAINQELTRRAQTPQPVQTSEASTGETSSKGSDGK